MKCASSAWFGGKALGGGVSVTCGFGVALAAKLSPAKVAKPTARKSTGTITAATPKASGRADPTRRLFVMTFHNTDARLPLPDRSPDQSFD